MPRWACGPECPFRGTYDFLPGGMRECVKHHDGQYGRARVHDGDRCRATLADWEEEYRRLGEAIAARRKVERPDASR